MSLRDSSAGGCGCRVRWWLNGLLVVSVVGAAWGATIRVPSDYPLIQQALDSALEGDTILVAPGTYKGLFNKNLDFLGRDLVLRSEEGADSTVIDCEGSGRGLFFHGGETAAASVAGFTVTGANESGVYCSYSGPTLIDCTILGNSASYGGGGVHCSRSNPGLVGCTITGNSASWGSGIYCLDSGPLLTNCTVANNAASEGGGVHCRISSPMLADCVITGNTAGINGGGVHCRNSSPTLTACTIAGNTADLRGGGIYCQDYDLPYSSPSLKRCEILDNSASRGGGVYCAEYSHPTLTNCTVATNTAAYNGGGIYCHYTDPTLTNCTIATNSATDDGGGVYCSNSAPTLTNCTIAANEAFSGGGLNCSSSDPTLTNCIVWGDTPDAIFVSSGNPDVSYSDIEGYWIGVGNINEKPLFVDPAGGDYHISEGSPCIDSGTAEGAPDDDIDGDPRPIGEGFDMGSDEWLPMGQLPTPFSLLSPTDGTIIDNTPIAFDWEDSNDPDSIDTIIYTLHIDIDPGFPAPIEVDALTQSQHDHNDLLANFTTFYWRVIARDSDGGTISNEVFYFNTNYPEAIFTLTPDHLDLTAYVDEADTSWLYVGNLGNVDLVFEAFWDEAWLDVDPPAGMVEPGGEAALMVTGGTAGLDLGPHLDLITVVTNAVENPTKSSSVNLTNEAPVLVELDPFQNRVPRGGSLDFGQTLINRSNLSHQVYHRFEALRGGNTVWESELTVSLMVPGEYDLQYFALSVPRSAPLGFYELRSAIGGRKVGGGGMLWDEDVFQLEVVGNADDAGHSSTWQVRRLTGQ